MTAWHTGFKQKQPAWCLELRRVVTTRRSILQEVIYERKLCKSNSHHHAAAGSGIFLILLLGDQIPPWHHEMAIVLLCVVPLISYLYWRISPELREQGRKSQRKLAIIFSVIGYVLGTVYCIAFGGSKTELLMYLCYVICGVLIALSSYVFHIKSSGHAAGVVGPVMILSLRVSPWYLFELLLMIPVGISSVKL